MAKTVIIASRLTLDAIYPMAAAVVGPNGHPSDSQIAFDFGKLTFVDGSGLTALCNILEWLRSHRVAIRFDNFQLGQPSWGRPAILYLDDCGFFARYLGRSLRVTAARRATTLPATPIAHSHSRQWVETFFSPWAADVLGVKEPAISSIRVCIGEVFNNIVDHSTLKDGFVHAQNYPNLKKLSLTIADFGVGIPTNIRKTFGPLSDSNAILKACEPGVTSQTTPKNMGSGLDYLVRYVTGRRGFLDIRSGFGRVQCTRHIDGSSIKIPQDGTAFYPGTLVDITFPTNRFVGDDDEREDVAW